VKKSNRWSRIVINIGSHDILLNLQNIVHYLLSMFVNFYVKTHDLFELRFKLIRSMVN